MSSRRSDGNRGTSLTPTLVERLGNPLDFLRDDHLHEREICVLLDRIAIGETVEPEVVDHALGFFSENFPAHIADEEEDLFPLLQLRCEPADDIHRVLTQLHDDHRHADLDTSRIAFLLRHSCEGLEDGARDELRRYANHARRHLILENAILLPFARLRLTKADLECLCARMARRRGPHRLMEDPHAS